MAVSIRKSSNAIIAILVFPLLLRLFFAPFPLREIRAYVTRQPTQEMRRLRAELERGARAYVGPGQCFAMQTVNSSAPCDSCVHFVSCAIVTSRWGADSWLMRALRAMAASLRTSQRCFTLHVYTDASPGSPAMDAFVAAAGPNVTFAPYPTNLPRNAYSGKNKWLELSRRKLDLVERYWRQFRRKVVWIDLDTIVATDLACAYARAPHFVVSRPAPNRFIIGPDLKRVKINFRRSVYGDVFMLDAQLVRRVRDMEWAGMPPPPYDLQDYFSYVLNHCDGSIIDLRALIRGDGFARGDRMCFGWDFSQGDYVGPKVSYLRMINGRLYCGLKRGRRGKMTYHPVGVLSFTADSYQKMLQSPEGYFRTTEVKKWANMLGIDVK